jgi:hypothetical protein
MEIQVKKIAICVLVSLFAFCVLTPRTARACTSPPVAPDGSAQVVAPGDEDPGVECTPAFNWSVLQTATRNEVWPPTTIIWEPLHCGTIGDSSYYCSIGWSDGSEFGNWMTTCQVFLDDIGAVVCSTSRMR